MSTQQETIQIEPDSEIGKLLEKAADSAQILESNGARYRVQRLAARPSTNGPRRRKRLEPERVLNIIGLGESSEVSNIARFKDKYVADAADHRGE